MYAVNARRINDSAGAPLTSYLLTDQTAVKSEPIAVDKNVGFFVLTVKEDKVGGAGDVDIYTEYCDGDPTVNANWNRPYISDLAGSLTQEGNIVTTLQNVTRRIIHTARLGRYVRYVFDPDADSRITVDHTFQEAIDL